MAASATVVRDNVYTLLGVTNPSGSASIVSPDQVRGAINRQVALVASHVGLGPAWVTGAIVTTLTDLDYTLANTVEYHQVIELVYAADRQPLRKISKDDLLSARAGAVNSSGRPLEYALDVNAAQEVIVMFPVKFSRVESIDAYASTEPADWPAGSGTPPTVPFSRKALRATEYFAAADLANAMGEDRLTALDLKPGAIEGWIAQGRELERQAGLDIIRIKRARGPRNRAWFTTWGYE